MSVDAFRGRQLGLTVLTVHAGYHVVLVQAEGQLLLAVADSQDWNAQLEEGRVGVWCVLVVDGVGPAAEDDTDRLELELGELGGAGEHLGVDIEFAKTADDSAEWLLLVTG